MRGSIYIDKTIRGKVSIAIDISNVNNPGRAKMIYEGDNLDDALFALTNYNKNKQRKLDYEKAAVQKNVDIAINKVKRILEVNNETK